MPIMIDSIVRAIEKFAEASLRRHDHGHRRSQKSAQQCGMRHPTSASREGDLSHLTSSSSSSSSPSSSSSSPTSPTSTPTSSPSSSTGAAAAATTLSNNGNGTHHRPHDQNTATAELGCTAATTGPDVIDNDNDTRRRPIDHDTDDIDNIVVVDPQQCGGGGGGGWAASRKRKDRQDSTSSTASGRAQSDRKLIRSNSEDLVADRGATRAPNAAAGLTEKRDGDGAHRTQQSHMRRVCSHEEFKRPLQERRNNQHQHQHHHHHHHHHHQRHHRAGKSVRSSEDVAYAPLDNNAVAVAAAVAADDKWENQEVQDILKETAAATAAVGAQHHHRSSSHRRPDTGVSASTSSHSPARVTRAFDFSHRIRLSPCRDQHSGSTAAHSPRTPPPVKNADADAERQDAEHERRRSSERFCRARAPSSSARKSHAAKRPSKYLAARLRGGRDESVYKYDQQQLSKVSERRPFVSGAAGGCGGRPAAKTGVGIEAGGGGNEENSDPSALLVPEHDDANENNPNEPSPSATRKHQPSSAGQSAAQPWESAFHQATDEPPQPCRRFADAADDETFAHRQRRIALDYDVDPDAADDERVHFARRRSSSSSDTAAAASVSVALASLSSGGSGGSGSGSGSGGGSAASTWHRQLGHFMKSENMKTREIMQNLKQTSSASPSLLSSSLSSSMCGAAYGSFVSPDERLRQCNKRLAQLKRRCSAYDEAFERLHGYRASQADRSADRSVRNAQAEMHKLRREKQALKADPLLALGRQRISGGAAAAGAEGGDAEARLERMRATVVEIEKHLSDQRTAAARPYALDALTTDQLQLEKIAVQKALVFFESLHGRPVTRDERDAARDLYARYRTLKRLVNRTVVAASAAGAPGSELPTIMEHEAMQFVQPAASQRAAGGADAECSGDDEGAASGVSLVACLATAASTAAAALIGVAAALPPPDSPLSDSSTATDTATTTTTSSSVHGENVHQLSLDELWHHLEVAREQKHELRRTIKDFEAVFEQQNGRRMLKTDRHLIEQTYAVYKQKKARLRLLEALVKKHMAK